MKREIIVQEKVVIDVTGTFQNLEVNIFYRDETYNLYWSILSGIQIPYELIKIQDEIIKAILEFLTLEKA